jgi:hypothetical protein
VKCLPLPLGITALGEPWPPLQPVSTALYPSSYLSILSPPSSSSRCSLSFAWSVSHMFRLSEAGCKVSEQNYFLQDGVLSPMPNPHPGGPGCLSWSALYPLTLPAWVALVVKLPPALLSGSQSHTSPTTTRWRHLLGGKTSEISGINLNWIGLNVIAVRPTSVKHTKLQRFKANGVLMFPPMWAIIRLV